eukprot:Rmarinus@m.24059
MEFAIGSQVDALDKVGKWYMSTIIDANEDQVLVHFEGWDHRFDEWIDKGSTRIQPLNSKSNGAKGSTMGRVAVAEAARTGESVARRRWRLVLRALRGGSTDELDGARKPRVRFNLLSWEDIVTPTGPWHDDKIDVEDISFLNSPTVDVRYTIPYSLEPGSEATDRTIVEIRQRIENRVVPRDLEVCAEHKIDNTGLVCLWPTEEVMTSYVCRRLATFEGLRVCELGAGFGLAGLALAKAGMLVSRPPSTVLVTDGNPQAVAFIQHNAVAFGPVAAGAVIHWAHDVDPSKYGGPFDVLLGSDCTFFRDFHGELCTTIYNLLSPKGIGLFFQPQRGNTLQEFLSHVQKHGGLVADVVEKYDELIWTRHQELLKEAASRSEEIDISKTVAPYDTNTNYPVLVEIRKAPECCERLID